MKKNNEGFTLIEVIISIALLGIICMGMITAMTSQYSLMRFSRNITQNLFEAQQMIEQRIEEVKKGVQSGVLPAGQVRTAYTLFDGANERTVYGYPNTAEVIYGTGVMKLYTIAADMSMPEFDVPTATDVHIDFSNGLVIPYAYVNTPYLKVKSQFTLEDLKHVYLKGIHRWYVSRKGFNIPSITNPLEIEKGTLYPRFPEDYVLIAGATTKDLTAISTAYAGRHLLYTITPASVSGKMGTTEISNPVFLSGLPVISNLKLHLDASMISREDSTAVNMLTSTVGGVEVKNFYVKQWKDVSGNGKDASGNGKVALQSDTSHQPELIETKIGNILVNGQEYESHAKFLRFDGNQGMTIADESYFDLDNLTVIVVAKSNATIAQKSIISKIGNTSTYNNTWRLGWNTNDQLGFFIRDSNNTRTNVVSAGVGIGLDGGWHVLSGSSQLAFQVDEGNIYQTTRSFTQSITNNRSISIGYDGGTNFSNVDIAEILVYEGALSATDLNLVQTYLKDKYKPIEPAVSIYALKPITVTVIKGETYTVPATVQAYMSNSTMQDVAVTWSPAIIDTSTVGMKQSIATAVIDPTKTTTLQVNVVEIESLENSHVKVKKDSVYAIPTKVIANLSDGTTKEVDVTWDISSVDTSILGSTTITGTSVLDTTQTMKLKVTVSEGARAVTLNDNSITINVGLAETLVATITPNDAFNQNVVWSSSNTSVATVSSEGVVSAIATGSAIITVTTEHGGFTANCVVTVP